MALTFGDQLNPDELGPSHYVVDHINFIRDDNRLENLQLLSVKANRLRTRRNQLKVIRIE